MADSKTFDKWYILFIIVLTSLVLLGLQSSQNSTQQRTIDEVRQVVTSVKNLSLQLFAQAEASRDENRDLIRTNYKLMNTMLCVMKTEFKHRTNELISECAFKAGLDPDLIPILGGHT
jgi:hypothetical protein